MVAGQAAELCGIKLLSRLYLKLHHWHRICNWPLLLRLARWMSFEYLCQAGHFLEPYIKACKLHSMSDAYLA